MSTKEMPILHKEVLKKSTWTTMIRNCAKNWQTRYKHLSILRLEVWTKPMMRLRKTKTIELRLTKYLIQEHLLFYINSSKMQRLNIFTDASVPVKRPMSTKQQVDARTFQLSKCYKKENQILNLLSKYSRRAFWSLKIGSDMSPVNLGSEKGIVKVTPERRSSCGLKRRLEISKEFTWAARSGVHGPIT